MKTFSIKGFAWQIPYLLAEVEELIEYRKHEEERGDLEDLENDKQLDK